MLAWLMRCTIRPRAALLLMAAAVLMVMACQISAPPESEQDAVTQPDPDDGPADEPDGVPNTPTGGSGPGTSAGDRAPALAIEPTEINVLEGSSAGYTVALAAQPAGPVAVTAAATSPELTVNPSELRFGAADWRTPQPVSVDAAQDQDAAADARAGITHAASGGGYDGVSATVAVTIVEDDVATLAIAPARAPEQGGSMRFEVTLSRPVAGAATVHYDAGAAGESATEDVDYRGTSGTLRFPPASTAAQAVEVTVLDDLIDEPDEQFTVTLSNPSLAVLAGGGATVSATGTIEDDDERGVQVVPTVLTVAPGGAAIYTVALTSQPTAPVTVAVEEPAGAGVSTDMGELTFDTADWRTARTVTVSAAADATAGAAAIVHRSGGGDYAGLPVPAVAVTISETLAALELSALEVTGGGTMYPAFDGGVRHYGMRCSDGAAVNVTAESLRSGAQLTLLRDNPDDNEASTDQLDAQVTVDQDHDIVIELSDNGDAATYVVHCLPNDFPDITILNKSEGASDGLLFITPEVFTAQTTRAYRYLAIVDYNGVPRYHRRGGGKNFRPYANGMTIGARRVRYSHGTATLLDDNLSEIRTVSTPSGNQHDFLITDDGTFLFVVYQPYVDDPDDEQDDRDFSVFTDVTSTENLKDGVIREVDVNGDTVFEWNSWDHLKLDPDCRLRGSVGDYSHLNSLHMVGRDIVASFKGCDQVVRIDRSTGTGAVEWQIGGTTPPRSTETQYLAITDEDGEMDEICGQHSAVVTDSGTVLLFDNGGYCQGPRKDSPQYTRVVEYDISSGTEASLVRAVEPQPGHGYADFGGAVRELDNGNWLITWGRTGGHTVSVDQLISISEVKPDGTTVFEMNMSKAPHFVHSYRAYLEPEADVTIPWNLP